MDRRSGQADFTGWPQDRPARGSLAELRLRLERLPTGHPSSPYDDQGAIKSSPQQLRQLELPLADEERDSDSPARASLLAATAGDRASAASPPPLSASGQAPEPDESPDRVSNGHQPAAGLGAPVGLSGLADLPRTPVLNGASGRNGTAGPAGTAEHNGATGLTGTAGSGESTRLAESTRPPEAAELPDSTDLPISADLPVSSEFPDSTDLPVSSEFPDSPVLPDSTVLAGSAARNGTAERNGSPDVVERTNGYPPRAGRPARELPAREAPDRVLSGRVLSAREVSNRPAPGSGLAESRPAGAADVQLPWLTPEQEEVADRALSRYRAAVGRNVFGSYSESGLTPALRRVEAHLPSGRLLPEDDELALKSPERFKAKLAKMIARSPGVPPEEHAAGIYDAARYCFVFEPQDYTDGTWLVHRRLKAQGFELEARRNRWESPEYKGIRTRWRDPAHDLAFEVQFHTPASWDVLQRTFDAYLRITDPRTPVAERAQLRAHQVAASTATRPPSRSAEIVDFRADAR